MEKRGVWVYAWWAGLIVLVWSLVILALCTFLEAKNPSLIEIWKYTLSSSIGYVIGLPIGTAFQKRIQNAKTHA